MTRAGELSITTPTDCEIVMTRDFGASRERVFDAHTRPELVRRWLLGPGGWTMPVCEIDLRVGGRYRYVWEKSAGGESHSMGIGGTYVEIDPPGRLVWTERFDEAWYPGEAVNTLLLEQRPGGGTRLTLTSLFESREARDTALRSGMETGVEAGFDRLEQLLAEETSA